MLNSIIQKSVMASMLVCQCLPDLYGIHKYIFILMLLIIFSIFTRRFIITSYRHKYTRILSLLFEAFSHQQGMCSNDYWWCLTWNET